jgi:hypothetical protein
MLDRSQEGLEALDLGHTERGGEEGERHIGCADRAEGGHIEIGNGAGVGMAELDLCRGHGDDDNSGCGEV